MKFLGESPLKKLIALIKGDLANKVSRSGDTMTGDLNLGNNNILDTFKVTGLGELRFKNGPVIRGLPDNLSLFSVGSSSTNSVRISGLANPKVDWDAVNKAYVDNKAAGLTGAMHFQGKATVDIADGSTTDPVISGYDFANKKAKGDVILGKDDHKEFVWNGSTWELLGDEGSYVLNTVKINKKPLSGDITLTASDVGAATANDITNEIGKLDANEVGGTGKYIQSINQTDGKISATPADMPTALKNPNALTFTGAVTGTYDGSVEKTVNIPIVDSALNATSTNAVQNKAAKDAIDKKISKAGDTFSGTLRYTGDTADSNPKNYAIALNFGSLSNIDKIDGINEIKFGKDDSSDDCIACLTTRTLSGKSFLDVQKVTNGQTEDVLFRGIASPIADNDAANKAYVNAKVPDVTTSDNNKFLRVVNGTPTWVALTNVAEEGA